MCSFFVSIINFRSYLSDATIMQYITFKTDFMILPTHSREYLGTRHFSF